MEMRIRMLVFILSFIGISNLILGQQELNYPTVQYESKAINANWVSHPDIRGGEDVTILFRNVFEVDNVDEDFIINISADNHYYLYVNESLVTHGPQLGDIQHWKYETLNLKDYLVEGSNVIAVKVINFGKRRSLGMQSIFTCLMVNACTDNASSLTTRGNNDHWKCHIDPSYKAIEVNWRSGGDNTIIGGFYANNPTDYVDMNLYPTGWKKVNYNDEAWRGTGFFEGAQSMGGSIAYLLEPRSVPLLTWTAEKQGGKIVRSKNMDSPSFSATDPISIPSNTEASFLMDWSHIRNGYPELRFSKGKNAVIKIKYAENLFGKDKSKGDRSDLEGKELIGFYDKVISNGDEEQVFIPNWMRTFRFIEFVIETADEPLEIIEYTNFQSRTKIPSTGSFTSDNEMYNRIFEICKRTVDICTQDFFLSDGYYEAMQYVGDCKIQSLVWQALSGNVDHTKNALTQFNQSRDAEGNILGAYPLRSTFIYPTYSLSWIDQVSNYFELTADTTLVQNFKAGIIHTLTGFDNNMQSNHLVNKTRYRYFVDWYAIENDGGGTATKNDGLNSAVVSLHYVFTLQKASKLMKVLGDTDQAAKLNARAEEIKSAVYKLCYDSDKEIFAERPDKTIYDQHTNIMAILTDAIPSLDQKALLKKIIENKDLFPASYYYRYYLFRAIEKVDAPELFDVAQKPWETMVNNNMTTTLERLESKHRPTRSEVHPWSAAPAYFYFTYLAGIKSTENNHKKVIVKPRFGKLKSMKGQMPTPHGNILFDFSKKENGASFDINLPRGMTGVFQWKSESFNLMEGANQFVF